MQFEKKRPNHAFPRLTKLMNTRTFFAISTLLVPWASAAQLPTTERFSVATGTPLPNDEKPAGEAVMTVYHPIHANGTAVVIYPGGGYGMLAVEPEGHGIAKWFGEHGVTGAVVEYRLPKGNSSIPIADAKRTTRIVRYHAADWHLKPDHIGNIGFSAGGHLASTAATHFDKGDPSAADPIERQSCRPDFSILIYPVIAMGAHGHGGSTRNLLGPAPDAKTIELFSNEKRVTGDTPPTFIAHAQDDKTVPPANSQMYFDALQKNHVSSEYLKLPSGGHGLNGYKGPMWEAWKTGCLKWLAGLKFISAADAKSAGPISDTSPG